MVISVIIKDGGTYVATVVHFLAPLECSTTQTINFQECMSFNEY